MLHLTIFSLFHHEQNIFTVAIFQAHQSQEVPYHDDSTASRLLSEVKHRRARLVLRWGTTLESRVLFFCWFLMSTFEIVVGGIFRTGCSSRESVETAANVDKIGCLVLTFTFYTMPLSGTRSRMMPIV